MIDITYTYNNKIYIHWIIVTVTLLLLILYFSSCKLPINYYEGLKIINNI